MAGTLSRVAGTALVTAASLYVSLLAADAALVAMAPPLRDMGELYRPDPVRGYAMAPNFNGQVTTSERFAVKTNADGYRDEPWDRDAALRILAVGDSFVFGEPLPPERGIVRRTGICLGAKARVYNAGVSGYGVPHVLATIRAECAKVQPAHVVYMYYLNDTSREEMDPTARTTMGGMIVQAVDGSGRRLSAEELAAKVATAKGHSRWSAGPIVSLSHLGAFLRQRGLHPAQLMSGSSPSTLSETGDPAFYPAENAPKAAATITEMAEAARACGAKFTMAVLPSGHEIARNSVEPATQRLLGLLAGSGIDILDLHGKAPTGTRLVLPRDRHYNDDGNAWVASHLARHLAQSHAETAKGCP